MLHKMPFVLVCLIALIAIVDPYLSIHFKSVLYALSVSVKSAIIFTLPVIIFMLLFKTICQLSKNATKLILLILAGVCISNFISTMISYQIGSVMYGMDISLSQVATENGLQAAWNVTLPTLVANDTALFSGLILGLAFSFLLPTQAPRLAEHCDKIVFFLLRAITYVVPFFISGFMVKLIHDKVMSHIVQHYAFIFAVVAASVYSYILFLYALANRFRLKECLQSIKNMIPAAVAGFSSMSSAGAMPMTIIGCEKNTKNGDLSRLIVPTTVNIHLIGDCFAIPIFAFAILNSFGVVEPSFGAYFIFALYFVLAKFSVAAIPGGGILVMLPLLDGYLGFTPEMASLITALYILFDPVITTANVLGNGAFAMVLDRVQGFLQPNFFQPSAKTEATVEVSRGN